MNNTKITFIGTGNMAQSLIAGLIQDGFNKANIIAADISQELLNQTSNNFGIKTFIDNQEAINNANVVVLAVKPFHIKEVLSLLSFQADTLIVSIAAGILTKDIENWSGNKNAVVRCMPNTPSLVQSGAAALFANPQTSNEQKQLAESILRAVGVTVWLKDEQLIDAVTALSGSGPAYYFAFMEAMIKAAIEMGLSKEQAQLLTKQTAFGAAKMALESDLEPDILRQNVTSKNGTTEEALNSFNNNNLADIVKKAMVAAQQRSAKLALELGDN